MYATHQVMNFGVTYCQRQTHFLSPIFFRLQLGFSPTLVETEVFNQFNQFNVINCYGVDASFYSRITDSDVKVRAGRVQCYLSKLWLT
jgi:hypothetical protein